MERKARVLVVGLDPAVVDYSRTPVPGLTAEILTATLEAERAKLTALGYEVRMLHIDTGGTAEAVTRDALAQGSYDCIVIGAGVRLAPQHFLLFEKIVNVVHAAAPATARICFNTRPDDTADAVLRWV